MTRPSTLTLRTMQLAQRIADACANPVQKPAFLHWSDAIMLGQVVGELIALREQVENQRKALEMALTLAK